MQITTKITIMLSFLFVSLTFAQQSITYNGKSFKKADILELQIGAYGSSFSFYISEHDLGPNGAWAKKVKQLEELGKTVNPKDAPKGLSLQLSVDLKNKLPFPIRPTDSIVIGLSNIKKEYGRNTLVSNQINTIDSQKITSEKKNLQTKKLSVEEQSKQIVKKMQSGQISLDEAMQQIEALTKPILAEVENSYSNNINIQEPEKKSYYDILFGDTNENVEAIIYEGNLHIVTLNENKLVAYITGKHIVECTDVVRLNASSKPCKQVTSTLIPELKVLKEEKIFLTINTAFKTFLDNRN